jgi:hypothetical protein
MGFRGERAAGEGGSIGSKFRFQTCSSRARCSTCSAWCLQHSSTVFARDRSSCYGVSFTISACYEPLRPSHGASFTRSRSIVHQVTEHRSPSHGVSFTRSRSIVHQVTERRSPSHGVSFTRSRSIVHQVTEWREPCYRRSSSGKGRLIEQRRDGAVPLRSE